MDYEQRHLDSLNKIIKLQDEIITNLKAEIERLKSTPKITINPPIGSPGDVYCPPNTQPFITAPNGMGTGTPLPNTTYIMTCGDPSPIGSGSTTMDPSKLGIVYR